MLFDELPTAFPWYDNLTKQNRFRENSQGINIYGLIAPSSALLPFQFFRLNPASTITSWRIYDINGNLVKHLQTSEIVTVTLSDRKYFVYGGAELLLLDGVTNLDLAPGLYYSRITFVDGKLFHSEVFEVASCQFQPFITSKFVKVEWWNDSDLAPLLYQYRPGDVPFFKNTVYLDTFVHVSEPEVQQDNEKDGAGEPFPTFEKLIRKYRISDLVPDYLKTAIIAAQMHDHIAITTPDGIRSGEVEKIQVNATPEINGAMATVDIIFYEALIIKKGCGENMV